MDCNILMISVVQHYEYSDAIKQIIRPVQLCIAAAMLPCYSLYFISIAIFDYIVCNACLLCYRERWNETIECLGFLLNENFHKFFVLIVWNIFSLKHLKITVDRFILLPYIDFLMIDIREEAIYFHYCHQFSYFQIMAELYLTFSQCFCPFHLRVM